jgi:hypothetical protein
MLALFTTKGGARIGWTNATHPFAQLSATDQTLTISVRLLGNYNFTPEQVSAVERYTVIPVLGWGIRIRHCRPDYPQRIIFWCLGNPDSVLRGIRDAGFMAAAPSSAIPQERSIAIRWSAILIAVAVWNALILLDISRSTGPIPIPGPFCVLAMLLAFLLPVGILKSSKLQLWVLKPERNINEIGAFLRLLAFISGIMLMIIFISSIFSTISRHK